MSEKPFPPSARRLRQAIQDGRFARSGAFSAAMVLMGGIWGLSSAAPEVARNLRAWAIQLWSHSDRTPAGALQEALVLWAQALWKPFAMAMVGAVIAGVVQVGFWFHPEWLKPKWERVDPSKYLTQLGSAERWGALFRAFVMASVLGLAGWKWVLEPLRALPRRLDASAGFQTLANGALALGWVGLGLGLLDWLWARRSFLLSMRMSRAEVLQELKLSEGDPHVKAHRRALQQELHGPARGVKAATALVVNPTHLAVALRYDRGECEAPYVTAKAREEEAHALRLEAERCRIPVVQDIPLARSLIQLEVGLAIPEELYQAAAVVLRVAEGGLS